MVLPPEAIELSDDEDIQIPRVAPSTRIGVLLATQEERDSPTPEPDRPFTSTPPPLDADVFRQGTETNNLAEARAVTPPPIIPDIVKQEEDLVVEGNSLVLLPIARGRSHSPTPVPLDSPVRRRRGYSMGSMSHRRSSPTRPDASPTRSAALRDGLLGPYSSRINNEGRIYDVLRDFPTRELGVLAEQVVASEEELFAYDFAVEWRVSDQDSFDQARLLASLWGRWVTQGR